MTLELGEKHEQHYKDQHETFVNQGFSCSQCAAHFVEETDELLEVDRDEKIKDLGELSTGRLYFVHWHVLPMEEYVYVCVYVYTCVIYVCVFVNLKTK